MRRVHIEHEADDFGDLPDMVPWESYAGRRMIQVYRRLRDPIVDGRDITYKWIGDVVGLSPTGVEREIKALNDNGFVSIFRNTIIVRDVPECPRFVPGPGNAVPKEGKEEIHLFMAYWEVLYRRYLDGYYDTHNGRDYAIVKRLLINRPLEDLMKSAVYFWANRNDEDGSGIPFFQKDFERIENERLTYGQMRVRRNEL